VLVGLFSPIKIPSVGALAGENAVDTGIGNVSEGIRLWAGPQFKEKLTHHGPLFSRQATEKEPLSRSSILDFVNSQV